MPAGEAVTESSNISGGGSDSTCRVRVSLASKELTLTSIDQPHREQRYKVTRMRCWRITTLHTVSIIKFYIVALKVLYTCKFTEIEYRLLVCCLPVVSTFIVFVTHSLTHKPSSNTQTETEASCLFLPLRFDHHIEALAHLKWRCTVRKVPPMVRYKSRTSRC